MNARIHTKKNIMDKWKFLFAGESEPNNFTNEQLGFDDNANERNSVHISSVEIVNKQVEQKQEKQQQQQKIEQKQQGWKQHGTQAQPAPYSHLTNHPASPLSIASPFSSSPLILLLDTPSFDSFHYFGKFSRRIYAPRYYVIISSSSSSNSTCKSSESIKTINYHPSFGTDNNNEDNGSNCSIGNNSLLSPSSFSSSSSSSLHHQCCNNDNNNESTGNRHALKLKLNGKKKKSNKKLKRKLKNMQV